MPDDSFAKLLNRFSDEAKLEGTFFFCRQDGVMQIAKLLEQVENLSLEDRSVMRLLTCAVILRHCRSGQTLYGVAAEPTDSTPRMQLTSQSACVQLLCHIHLSPGLACYPQHDYMMQV